MAVCGIGTPSGWRNSAVTANQSARPPTIAASAKARTKPQPAWCGTSALASRNSAAMTSRSPVATIRIRRAAAGPPAPPLIVTAIGDQAIT